MSPSVRSSLSVVVSVGAALGAVLVAAGPAVAASDPAVLNVALAEPGSEGSGISLSGSCPTGTLGAAAYLQGGGDTSYLLWPDGAADLPPVEYSPGGDPGQTLVFDLECYDVAYVSGSGFAGATVLGTASGQVTIPDLGSTVAVAAQTSAGSDLVITFHCGTTGDPVSANLLLMVEGAGSPIAQATGIDPASPYSFGTPAGLGVAAGATLHVVLLCTADGDDPRITSQRTAQTLVTAAEDPASGRLADTGPRDAGALGVVVALLLAGGVLLTLTRRRAGSRG